MRSWQIIALAAFFICGFAQIWLNGQIRRALIDRHPDRFLQIERSSIFPGRGLYIFILRRDHRELDDARLNRTVWFWHCLQVVSIICFLVFLGSMAVLPPP